MKKAFSLIELMIVIVIIGVVYTLAVSKLQNVGESKVAPSLANLKEYLLGFMEEDVREVRLLCLDSCESCSVYSDGVKQKGEVKAFFDESIEVYRYDFNQGPVRQNEGVFFDEEGREENVCFSFTMHKNLISDQIIVVYKEKTYDYTSYFEPTKVYAHLEELVDFKERLVQEVAR
ncbi:MAG: prepilin-type N-terminal cleavage/methylation domain-containing protein [Sulfurimonas sp.]|nr:prepilin-type N-terminal cleavage/methylation domain-containing protein [Sulfurimonas sp.]